MSPDVLVPLIAAGGSVAVALVSAICALILPVLIIGGVVYVIRRSGQKAKALNQSAQLWPSTTGTVITSRVEVSGGDYTSVNPHIVYKYQVNGYEYQSDQIRAGDVVMSYSGGRSAYDLVDKYPVGLEVTVYYDPANPSMSCLIR
jgi:hypothetical protein